MSELEADLAAIEGLERAIGQRQFYRLFPDQDMALPDGSVRHEARAQPRVVEGTQTG